MTTDPLTVSHLSYGGADETHALPRTLNQINLDFAEESTLYATHGLHAFAAKCPPQLAAWAIQRYSSTGETVLDPMMGSGTTLVEGRLLGRSVVGIDLDPVARLISQVKATPLEPGTLRRACEGLAQEADRRCSAWDAEWAANQVEPYPPEVVGLERWFDPRVAGHLAALKEAIAAQVVPQEVRHFFWVAFSSLIIARTSVANAWDLVHSRHHYRPHELPPDVPKLFRRRLRIMCRLMEDFVRRDAGAVAGVATHTSVLAADARMLPLANESVDLVFTSPPYCNALDYTRAHSFGVAWMADVLGMGLGEYVQLGRRYVGSGRAPRGRPVGELPQRCPVVRRVIDKVGESDAKKGLIVHHYFHDMWHALAEMARVLRPGRRAVLVVCPSHIRRVDVPTHEAFVELARAVVALNGHRLAVEAILERKISERRRVMPYLQDRFGPRMGREYVVVLRKRARSK